MEFKSYQDYVKQGQSAKYDDFKFAALALVGEVGEVCDVIKKASIYTDGDDQACFVARIKDELGDVLWQWTALANAFDLDVSEIIDYNVDKLNKRHGGACLDTTGGLR